MQNMRRTRGAARIWLVGVLAGAALWLPGVYQAAAPQDPTGWVIETFDQPTVLAGRAQLRVRPAFASIDAMSRERRAVLLPLPNGRVAGLRLDTREEFDSGYVASGPLTDGSGEGALSVVGDTLAARLVVDGAIWIVRRDASGHVVTAVDESSFAPDGEPLIPDMADVPAAATATPPVAGDAEMVDLLVVYTPAALARFGSVSTLQAEANLGVANGNNSLAAAGVVHRFRMVGFEEINYTESGSSSTDLARVRSTSDGWMDDVHTRRDALGADVVVMLTQPATPDVCGVGYVMTSNTTAFAPFAFNVTIATCAGANLTLAHETGHNLGLHHNIEDAGGGQGLTSYAYGHRVSGVGRTVMAYACSSPGCARVQVFSSPSAELASGVPAGIDNAADNARALNLSMPTAALFRTAAVTCSFAVTPTTATVGASGGTVNISVTTDNGCAWDVSLGSTGISASPASGAGNGNVTLTVPANTGVARILTVQVAGVTVTIDQAAACAISLAGSASTSTWAAAAGTLTLSVSASCSGTWTMASNASWLTLTGATTGGTGTSVGWSAAANTGVTPVSRQATVTATLGSLTAQWTLTQAPPTMEVSPARVLFVATRESSGAIGVTTPEQELPLTWTGPSAPVWTATVVPNQAARQCGSTTWLRLAQTGGTGAATLRVSVDVAAIAAGSTQECAALRLTAAGYAESLVPIDLGVVSASTASAPFGFLDTPVDGLTGVSGSIAVGGWALDDVGVDRVEIFRLAVSSDPPAAIQAGGLVFVGRALFVSGARPDVLSAFGTPGTSAVYPQAQRGGWGLLLLTNALPHQGTGQPTGGQGTFTLVAIATDLEGRSVELGRRTIHVSNDTAAVPFGAIDTPGQGGVVPDTAAPYNSLTAYPVFGWALSPGGVCIATDGSTIDVIVDGVVVGHPTYNLARSDIATGYPGYCNSGGAVGVYYLNASGLADGLHAISWRVRDAQGRAADIGSRYFRVSSGTVTAGGG
jgi:hypothetical protein